MFEKYVCPKCGGKLKKNRMVCFPSVLYVCRPCNEVYWDTELNVTDRDMKWIDLADSSHKCGCGSCGCKKKDGAFDDDIIRYCPKCGVQLFKTYQAETESVISWCSECEHTMVIKDEGSDPIMTVFDGLTKGSE